MGGIKTDLKNAERKFSQNTQRMFADTDQLFQGNFNNYGQTLQRNFLTAATAGQIAPEDAQNITGETTSERVESEKAKEEAAAVQQDIVNREDERRQQIVRRIAAEVEQRRIAPGTSLLTAGSQPLGSQTPGNTILTSRR